jgi:hypothetical protein
MGPDEKVAQLVPETGEVYFENSELSRKYRNKCHAGEHRLGNLTEIAELREEITRLIGHESLVVQKILCSGTHSGDTIPIESLSSLSSEMTLISSDGQQSPELRRFVRSIEELIEVAKLEGNPIVFV